MRKSNLVPAVVLFSVTLLIASVSLSSCTKTVTKTVTVYDTTVVVVKDTITVAPPPSTLSLLTGKQWELDSVYFSYTGPGTGTLVYARGSGGNTYNLDNYSTTYTVQGQAWAVENSTYYLSNWTFTNSDSTILKTVSPIFGTDYARVVGLSATKFIAYDSTNNSLDVEILAP